MFEMPFFLRIRVSTIKAKGDSVKNIEKKIVRVKIQVHGIFDM